MQDDESILTLQAKMVVLEAALQNFQRKKRLWRRAVLAALALGVSFSLYAQTPQGVVTLQSLAQRVSDLEKRVANDEASGANIPQQAGDGNASGSVKPPSTPTTDNNTALSTRVSALESEVSGLMDIGIQQRFVNDELKVSQLAKSLAQLQSQIAALKSSSASAGSGTAKGSVTSTVAAPFQVVDSSGKIIFSVDDGPSVSLFDRAGISIVTLGATDVGGTVSVVSNDLKESVAIGVTGNAPFVMASSGGENAVLGKTTGNGSMGVHVTSGNDDVVDLENLEGNGSLLISKKKMVVGIFAANSSNEGATLSTFGDGANNALEAGIDSDTGEPTLSILSKTGSRAKIGESTAGSMGVRIFGKGTSTVPIATMADQLNGTGAVSVTDGRSTLAGMFVNQGHGAVGANDGKRWAAALTTNDNGGEMYVANSTGQKVGGITTDPGSNTGQVLLYDSGGTPLVTVGVQGNHGDVLLNSSDKTLDMWKYMLLPNM